MQLLFTFELRDCCDCCTFGDLPSFSLREGVWRQEKEKKEREREQEREEGRGAVLCSVVICRLAKLLRSANPTGMIIPTNGDFTRLGNPLPRSALPTTQGAVNT